MPRETPNGTSTSAGAAAGVPRRRGRPPGAGPAAGASERDVLRVEAVERALLLLEAFADGRAQLTLSALAERAGLYPSTVLRLAASLERFGYLWRGADGLFRLGPTPLRLGLLYQNAFNLADRVRPALAALAGRTGETAAFYVREGGHRICLFRQHSDRPVRHHVEEGAQLPLNRGAGGRVLLAFGDAASPDAEAAALRRRGHCISFGERDPDTTAVAAPVFGPAGLAGALGVVGPRGRVEQADRAALVAAVMEAAAALTRALGGRPPDSAA